MSKETKALLRRSIHDLMKSLDPDYILHASNECAARVMALEAFQTSSSISIYLSMPKEIQTLTLLQRSFELRKRVFIPKIIGPNPEDMVGG